MKKILQTVYAKDGKAGAAYGRISKKISFPIAWGLVALLLLLEGGVYLQYAEERERRAGSELQAALKFYQYSMDDYRATMGGIVELLDSDSRLPDLLSRRDTGGLFALYGEAFQKMQQASGLAYLLFADSDRRVITRIHDPGDRNDIIERASFRAAEQSGNAVTTLDAGSDGHLSLRMVASVRSGEGEAGFIEAGMRMERMLAAAAKPEKVDILLALNKSHISEERISLDPPGDHGQAFWSDPGGNFYLYTTLSVNAAFRAALRKGYDEYGLSGPGRHHDIAVDNSTYAVASLPLADSSGNSLGALFVVYDSTALRRQYLTVAFVLLAATLAVAAIVREVLEGRLRTADADLGHMEYALEEGEHLFENVFAESDTAFIIRVPDSGAVLKANAAALDIFAASKAGDIDVSLLVPAVVDSAQERSRQRPLLSIAASEKTLFLDVVRFPVGKVKGLECLAVRDVTDSILLEREDQAHIEFLQAVINQLPGWVCIKDSSLLLTQTNNVFDAVFGRDAVGRETIRHSEWLGSGMDELLQADREALRSGKPVTFELTIPTGEAERVYTVTKQRFTGRNGQIFILSSGADITERAEMVNQLVTLNKKASEVAELKTQFLARMSHELRTPLNAVLGISHLALQIATDERLCGYLNKVREAANSLLRLISNILDFSQLEAGETRLAHSCFDLAQLMDEVEEQTRSLAAGKPITVVRETPGATGSCIGDPARIRQVLHMLCDNAVKFTEQGHVRILCAVEESADDRHTLRFAVEDTGIGISDEHLENLFDGFHQVDGGTTRKYGGTGLGLALTMHILALMESRLEVLSSPGQGSRFSFSLSLARPETAPLAEEPARQPAYAGFPEVRILVVEDNDLNQEIILELLAQPNMSALAVSDGRQAVDIVKEQAFDLILMDLQMPVMGGLEATRHIREFESGSDGMLPIIALTANALESDKAECAAAGMNDFISKPIDMEELYEKLRLWLPGWQ